MENFKIIGVSPSTKDVYLTGSKDVLLRERPSDNSGVIPDVPADLPSGSFAFTADFSYIAQKGLDGKWHQIGGTTNG